MASARFVILGLTWEDGQSKTAPEPVVSATDCTRGLTPPTVQAKGGLW
jgi:hypothetical protein